MDNLKTFESMGFTLPSPAYLIGAILFSIIGYAAYRYGKKASQFIFNSYLVACSSRGRLELGPI